MLVPRSVLMSEAAVVGSIFVLASIFAATVAAAILVTTAIVRHRPVVGIPKIKEHCTKIL